MPVEERLLSVDELFDAAKAGTLEEAMVRGHRRCGLPHRRAVLSGAGLCGQRRPASASCAQKLYDELTGIQWGKRDDPFGWTYRV